MITEENQHEVITEVTLSSPIKQIVIEDDDPFLKKAKDVRNMHGLSKSWIRSIERRLKSGFKGQGDVGSKQIDVFAVSGYNYLDCITPPYNMEYLAKLYDISSAHHAAVDAKVESVYGLGYDFIESRKMKSAKIRTRTAAGKKKAEQLFADEKERMQDWIDSVNKIDSFKETLRKIGRDYETTGNAYIEIGRDTNGQIGYIGHLPSMYVRVRRPRDGFVQVFANEVVYFRNFGEDTLNPLTDDQSPNEVLHLTKYSPSNPYYGIPDIISAKGALAGNEFATRYNLDYFENKAIPRHVIITRNASLAPAAVARLVEFFETGLRGQHHRSVYVPLGNNEKAEIEFKEIEAKTQDASFNGYREANNQEIFMAHRTPLTRAGVQAKGVSLAASRDADKVFKESVSRPEQEIFENKISKVFDEITKVLSFKLNELTLTDEDTQSKIDERDQRMGITVADEIRARRGWGPRPDGKGDEPWQANSQQAAEQKAQAGASRTRDSARSAAATDSAGAGRNEKGAGKATS